MLLRHGSTLALTPDFCSSFPLPTLLLLLILLLLLLLLSNTQQEDPFNAIMAGALTGGFLQLRAGLRPAFRSAVVGGVLLVS